MERVEKTYKISGSPEQIRVLEKFLVHMELLGTWGASRNLVLQVDGDGAARMKVKDEDGLFLSDYIKSDSFTSDQTVERISFSGKYSLE